MIIIHSLQLHLHLLCTQSLDIDWHDREDYGQNEGNAAVDEKHHVGTGHRIGHEGESNDGGACQYPVYNWGHHYTLCIHHETYIRPHAGPQRHTECKHEEHNGDAGHQ